jgi:hypothetical protein
MVDFVPLQVHKMEVKNKILKIMKKKKKRPKINVILSHVNHTFFILDPKPLDTLIVP